MRAMRMDYGSTSGEAGWSLLYSGVTATSSLVLTIAISAVIAYLIVQNFDAIPREHRTLEPTSKVWLLLIPLFNLFWNFVVFLGLSDSYKRYFDARGDAGVGDCGRQLGLWYSICALIAGVSWLPILCLPIVACFAWIPGIAALVLVILYLVKAFDLKRRVETGTGGIAAPPPTSPPPPPPEG